MTGELDYIRTIRKRIPPAPGVLVGPGDDCAVFAPSKYPQLVTTDAIMDGVDFILNDCGPIAAGRKAMLVNLSDIAAMAGVPKYAVVNLCLPRSRAIADGVFEGIRQVAEDYDTVIVGGDTNSWDGPLVIAITVIGECTERGPVLRSGAKPGDWLFVTGPLGGSIKGRHLDPKPRIREALDLAAKYPITAMIDISDGLVTDLRHLGEESGCGALLDGDKIPIHADADSLTNALTDGEDFELLFAVDMSKGVSLPPGCHHIGTCVADSFWIHHDGETKPLTGSGWEHRLG